MKSPYLIVQCGGLGTRMGYLTANKPKCLVSVFGAPLLKHLKFSFPESKLIIIGGYKYEVLKKYLPIIFPEGGYELIYSKGKGSASGIKTALKLLPKNTPFGIVWSDILFYDTSPITQLKEDNYIGLTNENFCRWTFNNGKCEEEGGSQNGIFGFFIFKNKKQIEDVPMNGEFVRYLSKKTNLALKPVYLKIYEVGTLEKYTALINNSSWKNVRFFNSIEVRNNVVIKKVRDERFNRLLELEYKWYKFVTARKYRNIPQIFEGFPPLKLSLINGKRPFETKGDENERKEILENIFDALFQLHKIEKVSYDMEEDKEVLVNKTLARINSVKPLLPKGKFKVNKKVIDLSNLKPTIKKAFKMISVKPEFCIIHGDPTFSNTLVTPKKEIRFIDPRGYYGKKEIFGNPYYDFAKLYYSCVGNYDQFNLKNFILKLDLKNKVAELKIGSNGYEEVGKETFHSRFSKSEIKIIKIMHALIWLALTGYVLDDYDSIVASYLNGARLLYEVVK